MAESNTVVCEPCEHDGNYKAASSWCHDCEAGYCEHCVDSHRRVKITRDHHLIPISDYAKASDLSISLICKEHNQKFDSFCPQHDTVLCRRCLQQSHNSCKEIKDIEKAVLGVKESVAISELEDCLTNALKNIDQGISSENENRKSLYSESENIKQRIIEQYNKLCKHLDQLKVQCLHDVDIKCQTSESQIEDFQKRLRDKHEMISGLKDKIKTAKSYASDLQTFVLIKDVAEKANSEIDQVRKELGSASKYNITMTLNTNLLSFVNSVSTFGEVVLDKNSDSIVYEESKAFQAQKQIVDSRNVMDLKLKLKQRFSLQQRIGSFSCLVLSDKKMVFTDIKNTSLIILNVDGSVHKNIQLGRSPVYIGEVDNTNIILTYGGQARQINIVNVTTEEVKKFSSVSLRGFARGISCINGKVYVVDDEIGILVMDCDGNLTNNITIKMKGLEFLDVFRDKLYCTATFENVVSCFDMNGQIVWKFDITQLQTSKMFAIPITVDGYGNVYVIGEDTCTIMAISPDGKQSKLLIDMKDYKKPRGLCYDTQSDTLVTYCGENNLVLVFQVK